MLAVTKRLKKIGHKTPVLKSILRERDNLAIDKGVLQLEKGNLEARMRDLESIAYNRRNFLAQQYLNGQGIEIGAAQYPVKLPPHASVKYVDVFSSEDLRRVFPEEYAKADIVDVDIVDDAEKLTKFKSSSLDFIIANHFLEHCLDPIGTILTMYSKLRKRGILYMAIPDKRYTFDVGRPITPYSHLVEERRDGTKTKFRKAHTEEAVRITDPERKSEASIKARVQELLASGFRIHYHVWTQKEMTELFVSLAKDYKIDLEIEALLKNQHEVIYILRKQPSTNPEEVITPNQPL